jgi:RimJ/RimL family protein N-acetyltransferase
MILKTPTLEDLYKVAEWRNQCPEALRSIGETTREQQEKFFENVIKNPHSPHKYYTVYEICEHEDDFHFIGGNIKYIKKMRLIGLVNLSDINYINGNAEIGIILDAHYQGKGYGKLAVQMILDVAFKQLRLENVYGECFSCNPSLHFWHKIIDKYNGERTILRSRKYWKGELYDSLYFTISKEDFNNERCGV